ncbi:hypothetical protein K4K51_007459 [Colletotrichum sp. SAR 10_75]|nr:hypothetical protein K4K51_007459 [Colletotrichum sp. SAR 10_75]
MSSGQNRGRPLGSGAGVKRKAEGDYSDNANTKKSRQRVNNMNEAQKAIDRAKKALGQQRARKIKALKTSNAWINASATGRANLEAREIQQVDAHYTAKGTHPSQLLARLTGPTTPLRDPIVDEDGDEDWKDIPLDEIDEDTQMNLDDVETMLNFDVGINSKMPDVDMPEQSAAIINKLIKDNQIREYQFFRDTWEVVLERLYIKIKRLSTNPTFTLVAMHEYGLIRPGCSSPMASDIFTKEEILLWFAIVKYWQPRHLSKKMQRQLILNACIKKIKTPALRMRGMLYTTAERRYSPSFKPSVKDMFSEIGGWGARKDVWELMGPSKLWDDFAGFDQVAELLCAIDRAFSAILQLIPFFLKLELSRDHAPCNWHEVSELAQELTRLLDFSL